MGLQVWLPLNGNLNNLGLDGNLNIVNNGATVNASGKIGQCYSFNGNDQMIAINSPTVFNIFKGGTQQFSITFWVLHEDTRRAIIFGDWSLANSIGFNVELSGGHQVRFYWNGSPDWYPSINVGQNTWTHLAIVYNGTTLTVYKNGVVTSGISWTGPLAARNKTAGEFRLGRDARTTDTALKGRLNDFRIYDHCLSVKEVEEISKGLVLHYKLDNNGLGNPNNINPSKVVNRGCTSFSYNSSENLWTLTCPINSSTWGFGFVINDTSIKWKTGEAWVISMEVYTPQVINWQRDINNKPDITDNSSYTGNDYDITGNRPAYTNGFSGQTLSSGWNKIWFAQIAGTSYGLYNYSTNWGVVTTSLTEPITIKVRNIKGEIISAGDLIRSTPYSPFLENKENIIYDCSGYQNYGEIINNISIISDTPRYNAATHMSATNQKIKISNFPTSGFENSYTFAWWEKISSAGPMHWGFADGIRLNGMYTGRLWNTGDSSNNPLYIPGTTTQVTTPSTGIWHHWVMTGDGTTCKVYQDGVLWGQAKTYKAISGSTIYINGWDSGTSYCSDNASMSDFRIYCTALTAEQIKELYNTSASVDKSGNMYAREVVE